MQRINQWRKVTAVTEVKTELESTRDIPALLSDVPPMHMMAALQVTNSSPGRCLNNERVKSLMAPGAMDLYDQFGPEDAAEVILFMLAVSVTSASLDCLTHAASTPPDHLETRDINLRHGLKGAAVAAELIKALDARRGN